VKKQKCTRKAETVRRKESCFVPVEEGGEKGGLSREVWEERELELEASGKACEKRRG
jgi:hypothetical protein